MLSRQGDAAECDPLLTHAAMLRREGIGYAGDGRWDLGARGVPDMCWAQAMSNAELIGGSGVTRGRGDRVHACA